MTYREAKKKLNENLEKVIGKPYDGSYIDFAIISSSNHLSEVTSRVLGGELNENVLIQLDIINDNDLEIFLFPKTIKLSINSGFTRLDNFLEKLLCK